MAVFAIEHSSRYEIDWMYDQRDFAEEYLVSTTTVSNTAGWQKKIRYFKIDINLSIWSTEDAIYSFHTFPIRKL